MFFRIIAVFFLSFQAAAADEFSHEQKCLIKSIYYLQRSADFMQFLLDQELLSEHTTITPKDILSAVPEGQHWESETVKSSDWTGESEFLKLTLQDGKENMTPPEMFPYALKLGFDEQQTLSTIEHEYAPCTSTEDVKISDGDNFLTQDIDLLPLYQEWLKKSAFVNTIALRCGCLKQKITTDIATSFDNSTQDVAIAPLSLNLYQQVVALGIEAKPSQDGHLTIMSPPVDDGLMGFAPLNPPAASGFSIRMNQNGNALYFLPYHER